MNAYNVYTVTNARVFTRAEDVSESHLYFILFFSSSALSAVFFFRFSTRARVENKNPLEQSLLVRAVDDVHVRARGFCDGVCFISSAMGRLTFCWPPPISFWFARTEREKKTRTRVRFFRLQSRRDPPSRDVSNRLREH